MQDILSPTTSPVIVNAEMGPLETDRIEQLLAASGTPRCDKMERTVKSQNSPTTPAFGYAMHLARDLERRLEMAQTLLKASEQEIERLGDEVAKFRARANSAKKERVA